MRLVQDRLMATATLANTVGDGECGQLQLQELKALLAEEIESKEKSLRVVANPNVKESYRKGMITAAENSAKVISLLKHAGRAIKAGDCCAAADLLGSVQAVRGPSHKAKKDSPRQLLNAYLQYKMETDKGFRKWLMDHEGADND